MDDLLFYYHLWSLSKFVLSFLEVPLAYKDSIFSIAEAWVPFFPPRSRMVCKDYTKTWPSLFLHAVNNLAAFFPLTPNWYSVQRTSTVLGHLSNGMVLTSPYLDSGHFLKYQWIQKKWTFDWKKVLSYAEDMPT